MEEAGHQSSCWDLITEGWTLEDIQGARSHGMCCRRQQLRGPYRDLGRLHSSSSSTDRRFPSIGPLGKSAYGFNCRGTLKISPPPLQFLPPIPWSKRYLGGAEGTSNTPHTSGSVDLIMVGWDQLEGCQGRDRGGDGNSFHGACLKVTIREKAKSFHI